MPDNLTQFDQLSPGAQLLVRHALSNARRGGDAPGLHEWLSALLDRHAPMLERLAPSLDAAGLRRMVQQRLQDGDPGLSLGADELIVAAHARAAGRGLPKAAERDLAAVVLELAGYPLAGEEPAAALPTEATIASVVASAPAHTPSLDRFGRDLSAEADAHKLPTVVGRDDEMDLVIETICRRTKRNPLLVGPAGVGKTAIVEGLAQRIRDGQVPALLRNARLIAVQPSALVAGANMAGELERRVHEILSEASQPGVLLFIDEVHSMIGAGGAPGTGDIASLFKPAIARGDLVCIAATTDDEYRTFIERDGALERRFQPIRVQEMSRDQTLRVLETLHAELAALRGVAVPAELLEWLVDFAAESMRNRHFPDKAVDLLEQCVAHAVARGKSELTRADVESVVRRMTGMPLGLDERLATAERNLRARAVTDAATIEAIIARLNVTMRGLDVRPDRPNAVLLAGGATNHVEALSATLAESLFGDAARVVRLDFGRLSQPHDITMLIGAPPGYVGYSESLLIHDIAQMPFCVVVCENVDAADPGIREFLARCITDGYITDARGKRIHIRDTIMLLTTAAHAERRRFVGFHDGAASVATAAAVDTLGSLGSHIDIVCGAPGGAGNDTLWLRETVLSDLASRYRKHGIVLHWDDTFVDWLLEQQARDRDLERVLDTEVNPFIIAHLHPDRVRTEHPLVVRYAEKSVQVHAHTVSP